MFFDEVIFPLAILRKSCTDRAGDLILCWLQNAAGFSRCENETMLETSEVKGGKTFVRDVGDHWEYSAGG